MTAELFTAPFAVFNKNNFHHIGTPKICVKLFSAEDSLRDVKSSYLARYVYVIFQRFVWKTSFLQ